MAKAIKPEKGNKTPVDEGATVVPGRHAMNGLMAGYKAEKTWGFEPDFDWDGWPETDGDLNEEDLHSLLYQMSTEENASN